MTVYEDVRMRLLDRVAAASGQRLRPNEVKQALARELDLTTSMVNEVVKDLVDDGELVYAYRDPCSYLEIPCNGCDGGHRAARPMKIVTDGEGNPWICDDISDPLADLSGGDCWECGTLGFTRSG